MNTKIKEILSKSNYNFDDLVVIVSILRGEGGCPWDIEHITLISVKHNSGFNQI